MHRRGMRYRTSTRPIKGVPRTADLVFRSARVAVFLDGCFWHGCPEHFSPPKTNSDFWLAKIAVNQQRDRDTDRQLLEAGWLPIRIWEHEPVEAGADIVEKAVRGRNPVLAPPAPLKISGQAH